MYIHRYGVITGGLRSCPAVVVLLPLWNGLWDMSLRFVPLNLSALTLLWKKLVTLTTSAWTHILASAHYIKWLYLYEDQGRILPTWFDVIITVDK